MAVSRSSGDLAADRRHAWGVATLADGDHAAAADLFAQAVALAPDWPAGWFALGDAQARAGDAQAARTAFARALALHPADELGAALRLARLDGAAPAAMPPAYVRGLFDDYAPRFDAHLGGALGYRGPVLLKEAVADVAGGRFAHVLDLGCGTGLAGACFRADADRLAGVDLSPAMVGQARARGVYDRLAVDDVVDWLTREPPGAADLALAADVVVYLGDLAPLCAAVARAIAPGGLFALTAQALQGGDFGLGGDLRFAHSEDYLRSALAAAGLAVASMAAASTRRDAGRDVPGLVVVARRPQM